MTVRGLVDYHLHTNTSSDGHATVAEYCERASALGLAEIAITNHMNLREEKYHLTPEVLADVWEEIQVCQERHPELTIRLGIEVDYFEDLKGAIAESLPTYAEAVGRKLDFIMGAAHEMHGVRFASKKQAHNLLVGQDPVPIYRTFFELMTEVVESGLFDIVAHPDLIRRFTGLHSPPVPFDHYAESAQAFIDTLVERSVGIEVNVKGLVHPVGDVYPSVDFLQRYLDSCARAESKPIITLGTDAHRPENLGTGLDVGANMLMSLGVSELTTFCEGVRNPFLLAPNQPSEEGDFR